MESTKKNNCNIIAYPGIKGAFSHLAALKAFLNEELRSYPTFEDVAKAVEEEKVTYGVIPFENSYTGEVGEVSGLLRKFNIFINKTLDLKIDQNLLGIKGAVLSDIKTVYSHPQAISQSMEYLKENKFQIISSVNTAIAAKYISDEQDVTKGAIASKVTADLYNLQILKSNINTITSNTTRFIVISKEYAEEGDYFQILFTVNHDVGALARVLVAIAENGFNMLNIKSHPIVDRPWHYYFHVELVGNLADEKTRQMIVMIKEYCTEIKLLGGYVKI